MNVCKSIVEYVEEFWKLSHRLDLKYMEEFEVLKYMLLSFNKVMYTS